MIAGKEKGKKGTISRVLVAENKVIIDGVNIGKRAMRPRKAGEKGGIIDMAMPLHASNVKLAEKKKAAKKTKKGE